MNSVPVCDTLLAHITALPDQLQFTTFSLPRHTYERVRCEHIRESHATACTQRQMHKISHRIADVAMRVYNWLRAGFYLVDIEPNDGRSL